MVGILLLTHAPLGQAFIAAAAHVFHGRPERMEAIDVLADQDLNLIHQHAKQAIARLDQGDGVLIITDVIGGTPSNCCLKLADPGRVEIIAGLNLPMLLRALTYRYEHIDVTIEMALAGGQNGAVRVDQRIRLAPY